MLVFPRLTTARLILRRLEPEDFPALVRHADNQKVTERIANMPYPYREPDAAFRLGYVMKGFKERKRFAFAIVLRAGAELIGEISINREDDDNAQLAYWLGEPFWGQGLMTEAVAAVLAFGFEQLPVRYIYASCHPDNPASARVLEKNGLTQRKSRDQLLAYAVTRSEYEAR
jgi:RimJ/RimL family protein N-acetyltransferase